MIVSVAALHRLGGRSEEISQVCVVWGKAVAVSRYQTSTILLAFKRGSEVVHDRRLRHRVGSGCRMIATDRDIRPNATICVTRRPMAAVA